jgi:hypothetical protein
MENIVFTYHFLNDQIGYNIIDSNTFEFIKQKYPNYREIMMDETINPFGARPTHIVVDLYGNAEFVEVESEVGSIEYLLGNKTTKLVGTFKQHLEIL